MILMKYWTEKNFPILKMDIYVQMEMFNKNGFFIFIIENSWNTEQRKILLFKKMVFQLWWECQISFLATKYSSLSL